MENEICIKIVDDKETSFSLWRRANSGYAIINKFDGINYGLVGTELKNPILDHEETIQTIFKKFPESRKGQIKLNIVVVENHESEEMGNGTDKKAGA